MRISLITEGTYPTSHGGVSVWCDQLVRGVSEHEFDIRAIVATGSEAVLWDLPANVRAVTLTPLWGATPSRRARRRDVAQFREIWPILVRTLVEPGAGDPAVFVTALRGLRELALRQRLTGLVRSAGAVRELLGPWRAHPLPGRELRPADAVPIPTVSDAARSLGLLEHLLRPLGAAAPDGDACHTVSNGLASLVALAAKWERGTPFLLTEHGIYLRERYLEYRGNGTPFPVRALLLRFFRLLTAASYREADLITPGSDYNLRWQLHEGAPPQRVSRVYNGIDPSAFPQRPEPSTPTLSWLGRITPIKDVETLVRAFRIVADRLPAARLRLFGSAPPGDEAYRDRCVAAVDALGLAGRVTFEGRVDSSADAYHAGSVVVLSSTSEGFPYTVIEAMATGRTTVSTDVGGVREAVGDTGLVVPARDPAALADACVRLLTDAPMRLRMAAAARRRALELFTLEKFLSTYRALYPTLTAGSDRPPAAWPGRGDGTPPDGPDRSAPTTAGRGAHRVPRELLRTR